MNGELPEGWAYSALGEITDIRGGLQKQPRRAPKDHAFPYLRVANVLRGRLDLGQIERMELFGDEPELYRLASGDLLVVEGNGSLTEIGRSAIWHGEIRNCVHQNHIIRVRSRTCSSEFLDYFWNSPAGIAQISAAAVTTSGLYSLSTKKVASVVVPVAPLPEQRRIVQEVEALLDQVRHAKDRLDRVPLILKRFRRAVLAAACSGELTREWREKHPDPSCETLLQDLAAERTDGRGDIEIPESWAWVPFDALVLNHDGKRVPVKSSDREKRRGTYPYYGASGAIDTIDNFLFDGVYLLIGEDGANLLSRSTPIAFTAQGRFWVNNHAHVVQPRPGVVQGFLEAQFNSIDLQDYVTGTAQPKLTQAALNRIPMALPPNEEQSEIVRQVGRLFALADTIERRVQAATARAEKLPQAILSKAFSGELVPTEADLARAEGRTYETAEELLARVGREAASNGATAARKSNRRGRVSGRKAR